MSWIEWIAFGAVALLIVIMLGSIHERVTYLDQKIERLVREQYRQRFGDIDVDTMLRSLVTSTPYAEVKASKEDNYKDLDESYRGYLEKTK